MNQPLLAQTLRIYATIVKHEGLEADDTHDVSELLNVLARVAEGKTLAQAFGAPGDWGYDTPIGQALNTPPSA